jgi:predicted nucleic acid-binding protein
VILYLDASALVKRYVAEMGSLEMSKAIAEAEIIGTVLISRAEVGAALAKAVRARRLTREGALTSLQIFRQEWRDIVRVQVTEMLVARADLLAWDHGLRGYNAVQLAAAILWQDAIGEVVTMATFDQQLWSAAGQMGLEPYPIDLPTLLEDN